MTLDPAEKERLVEEFRACLEDWEGDEEEADEGVDLHSLLTELAALKNDIRLESRQFKGMLEEMRSFGDTLREQNERLNRDLDRAREQTAAAGRQAERGLLLELIDLRDRLQAGAEAAAAYRPAWLSRLVPSDLRFARSLEEGLALTLRKMDGVLAGHRVQAIEAVGRQLDPHRMRAVGVEAASDRPDGQVLREARRGFVQHGELLRAAEVIVNKRQT